MKRTRGQYITHALCLIPLLYITADYYLTRLTANPVQAATFITGRTALNLISLTLACSTIKEIFHLSAMIPIRKTLGLCAFFYAVLHFLIFAGLNFNFNSKWIMEEIRFKPFIQIGIAALVLLIPLAVASINLLRRKMGKQWGYLHKTVYLVSILIHIHFLQASKGDIGVPILYTAVFVILMLLRLPPLNKMSLKRPPDLLNKTNQFLIQ